MKNNNTKFDHLLEEEFWDSVKINNMQNQGEDAVTEILSTLPMTEKELQKQFEQFLLLDPDEVHKIAKKNIKKKDSIDAKFQYENDGTKIVKNVLAELDSLKDKLGGSPNFVGRKPTLPDSNEFFLGIPMSAVKDWFQMTLKKEWSPKFFWEAVSGLFGVYKNPKMSQYEEAHLRIQRFGLVLANKEHFKEILDNKDEKHYADFSQVTGLAWHPTKNGSGVEKVYIDFTEQFLTAYFEDAKSKGQEALIEYFKAFEGVCFEDRARTLEEYAKAHQLSNKENAEVDNVADWGTDSKAEDVFMKETVLLYGQLGEPPTPTELFDHLESKGIFEIEFKTKDGTKAKPTKEQFNNWAEKQIDDCILSEEKGGPRPS